MAINLVLNTIKTGPNEKTLVYDAYFTGTYTNNPAGDNIDLTASLNPDGTNRNPKFLPDAFPARRPDVVEWNGGDMSGAYIGIKKDLTSATGLTAIKSRFYSAGGNEVASAGAYPAGTPGSLATTNVQVSFSFPNGVA